MPEAWREVSGYEGLYEVSDQGSVRRVLKKGYRILKLRNALGYRAVHLSKNGAAKSIKVHNLVTTAFLGAKQSGMEPNHKNGVKTDNSIDNLEYVTKSGNIRHRIDVLGVARSFNIKLTEEQVRDIRQLHAEGVSGCELARRFGVTYGAIYPIVHRRAWTQVA